MKQALDIVYRSEQGVEVRFLNEYHVEVANPMWGHLPAPNKVGMHRDEAVAVAKLILEKFDGG